MSVSTIITRVVTVLRQIADRDAAKAVADQRRFKKQAAARADVIREELRRAEARVSELMSDLGQAKAQATLGDNKFNERERKARTLSRQLSNIG